MLGYWRLPDATEATLRHGWLHTGDVMRLDTDGFLYFVDRAKDMIKPGGENVYSIEVEAVLLRHPHVVDCAVVGVPDGRWGEAVKAIVVIAPGAPTTHRGARRPLPGPHGALQAAAMVRAGRRDPPHAHEQDHQTRLAGRA